jgi:hypothetical protein
MIMSLQVNNTKYASYRVMVKFNSTNSTSVRNAMFAAVAAKSAKPCSGGYNRGLYANVAALWARGPFVVSQNCKYTEAVANTVCKLCMSHFHSIT